MVKDFGVLGAVFASTGINIYLFYKLFTNHLKHLAIDISNVDNKIDKVDKKVDDVSKELVGVGNRVSKLEGMVE
jgi:peptidoglycan hydrolase CwlO-like protein